MTSSFLHYFFKETNGILDVSYILLNDYNYKSDIYNIDKTTELLDNDEVRVLGATRTTIGSLLTVDNKSIVKNGDKIGVFLTFKENIIPKHDQILDIYYILNNQDVSVNNIGKMSNEWIQSSKQVKYKSKYFLSERYQNYFQTQSSSLITMKYELVNNNSLLNFNSNEISLDSSTFIKTSFDDIRNKSIKDINALSDNYLVVSKNLIANKIDCQDISTNFTLKNINIDASNVTVLGDLSFNQGITQNNGPIFVGLMILMMLVTIIIFYFFYTF